MAENYRQLTTIEQWEDAFKASYEKPLLVFKHSTRCSVSAGAYEEFTNWLEDIKKPHFDTVLVRVVEERPISLAIADTISLTHASPQAILIQNGKVSWHTSHWNITYSALQEHIGEHCEK